jgi:hypothetical protein
MGMKARCYNHKNPDYPNYGGRGIIVCEKWLNSYDNFLKDMGQRPEGYTLDRIETNGNYEPGNCRWATWSVQRLNQRRNHLVTFHGETLLISEWAKKINMKRETLANRILTLHWPVEFALITPVITKADQSAYYAQGRQ